MNCPICRANLPAGSRFCNACGASIGGGAPQGDRTISYPPPQAQTPHQAARPGAPAGGYSPPIQSPYAPPIPAPRKKPVALLAALITVVVVGVGGATVALVKNRQASVTGGPNGSSLPGNPVTQVASGALPPGPAATSSPNRPAVPGQPVTASPNLPKPKPGDDMAPPVSMAGDRPGTQPSVLTAPTVSTPQMPVTAAPNLPARPQAPVTAAPAQRPRPQAPVTGAQPPQAPRNDAVFDNYLRWLQYVEGEKQKMTAMQATMAQQQTKEFYDMLFAMADPNAGPEVDRKAMAMPQQKAAEAAEVQRRIGIFWTNMLKTKPPVPEDCKWLDYYYTEAARQTIIIAQSIQQALPRMDIGTIKGAAAQQRVVNANLKRANQELEKVRDVRRLPFTWMIQEVDGGGGGGLSLPGM